MEQNAFVARFCCPADSLAAAVVVVGRYMPALPTNIIIRDHKVTPEDKRRGCIGRGCAGSGLHADPRAHRVA